MRKYESYNKVEAYDGEYERLAPGGYICRIVGAKAEERKDGTLLRIAFDIAEGEHKDYYKRQYDRKKASSPDAKWPGMYFMTVNDERMQYFKGFITAIEKSNPGYNWEKSGWNENTLVGKLFGGVFGEEEFEGKDGKIYVGVKCRFVRSVDAIREGRYTIPARKTLNKATNDTTVNSIDDDDEVPF